MLMRADASALIVVDIQSRLAPAVAGAEGIIARAKILLAAAGRLGIPTLFSEQYPQGLGPTDERLRPLPTAATVFSKVTFSALRDPSFRRAFERLRRPQVVLCGMEAHVCVLQTAVDLRGAGFEVFVAADAVGSRRETSRQLGLDRMRDCGIDIVETEMVVFEWLEAAGTDQFKELSRLIK